MGERTRAAVSRQPRFDASRRAALRWQQVSIGEPQDKKKETDKQQTYNQRSNVRVLGYATLSPSEMTDLSDQEKQAIRD